MQWINKPNLLNMCVCVFNLQEGPYLAEKRSCTQSENNINCVHTITEERCEDITKRDLLDISLKNLLFYYCGMTREWCKENYTHGSKREEISRITWLKAGAGKPRWFRIWLDSGIYVLCSEKKDAKLIWMKGSGTVNWREEVYCTEW